MRYSFFGDVMQYRLVVGYQCFKTNYWSHLEGLTLEDWTNRLYRNDGNYIPT